MSSKRLLSIFLLILLSSFVLHSHFFVDIIPSSITASFSSSQSVAPYYEQTNFSAFSLHIDHPNITSEFSFSYIFFNFSDYMCDDPGFESYCSFVSYLYFTLILKLNYHFTSRGRITLQLGNFDFIEVGVRSFASSSLAVDCYISGRPRGYYEQHDSQNIPTSGSICFFIERVESKLTVYFYYNDCKTPIYYYIWTSLANYFVDNLKLIFHPYNLSSDMSGTFTSFYFSFTNISLVDPPSDTDTILLGFSPFSPIISFLLIMVLIIIQKRNNHQSD
jgi:hypothetical protein